MQAVFALAFLAIANAAFIDYPAAFYPNDVGMYYDYPNFSDMANAMFHKYGFMRPVYDDDFYAYAKTMGMDEFAAMNYMRAIYDEPALMFFRDATDNVVSYYADSGIYKSSLVPEVRSAFDHLIGSANNMVIAFRPQPMLAEYRTILPSQFFVPTKSVALSHYFSSAPMRALSYARPDIQYIFPTMRNIYNQFDIDTLPFVYKYPVELNYDVSFVAEPRAVMQPHVSLAKAAFPVDGARFYNYYPQHSMYNRFYPSYFNKYYPYAQGPFSHEFYNSYNYPYAPFRFNMYNKYPYNFAHYAPYNFAHYAPYNFAHDAPYNFAHYSPYNFGHYQNNFPYYYSRHNFYNRPYAPYDPFFYGKSALKVGIPTANVVTAEVPHLKAGPAAAYVDTLVNDYDMDPLKAAVYDPIVTAYHA